MADIPDLVTDYQQQQQNLQRQQILAQLLMKKGEQQPQGQMVGRFYVPPSFTQQLSSVGGELMGAKMTADVNSKMAQSKNQLLASILNGGSPSATPPDSSSSDGTQPQVPQNPQAPGMSTPNGIDRRAMALVLSGDPNMAKLGSMIQDANKPIVAREGAPIYERDPVTGQLRVSAFTPKMETGQTIGPNGTIQTVPGFLPSQTEIGQNKADIANQNELVTVNTPSGPRQMTKAQALGLSGATPRAAPPSGPAPGGMPGIPLMSPQQHSEMEDRGKHFADLEKTIDNDAIVAQQGNVKLGELQDLVKSFQPGKTAPLKQWLTEWANGAHIPLDQKALNGASDMEAFNKIALGLATQQAKQLSSRPSQLEFQKMIEANPNISLLPEGLQKIIVFNKYQNDLALQKQSAKEDWLGKNGSMKGFESNWNQQLADRQKAQQAQQAQKSSNVLFPAGTKAADVERRMGALTKNPDGSFNYVPRQ